MLCQFQGYRKENQLYVYIYPLFFRFFSHIGHYRVLSRVPCALPQVHICYIFYIQQCVYVNPNLPSYPSSLYPLVIISFFGFFFNIFIGVKLLYNVVLVSVVQHCESAICIHISLYPLPLGSLSHHPQPTPLGGHKATS